MPTGREGGREKGRDGEEEGKGERGKEVFSKGYGIWHYIAYYIKPSPHGKVLLIVKDIK